MNDEWCPNCRQLVRPTTKRRPKSIAAAVVFWLILVNVLYALTGADWLWLDLLGSGAAVWLVARERLVTSHSCPICGTERLELQPSAEH